MFIKSKKSTKVLNLKKLNEVVLRKKGNRLCAHDNHHDEDQGMLIMQKKNYFHKPKKNLTSNQTFVIISGKLLVLTLDKRGKILKKTLLSKKDNLICRIKKNTFHCDIALKNNTLHYETTTHSFLKRKLVYLNQNSYKSFQKNLKKIISV
tara:strand:+ start:2386 stop:2835 length:450 start_codon:yes stop_codon:yes gene_type:complete